MIGVGRIGARVLRRTRGFGTPRILVNDITPNPDLGREFKLDWVTKEQIYADAVAWHEAARETYQQTVNLVRQWPFQHDAEHQHVSDDALDAVVRAAMELGRAGDARDVAWRALKRERRA